MADEWIVRVQGKEYGPVDLEELREWRRDGRLIRENEVREAVSDRWFSAAELAEVFGDEPVPAPVVRRLSLAQIFSASFRVYRQGFGRFFLLALLVSVPSLALEIVGPFLHWPGAHDQSAGIVASGIVAFLALVTLIIAWPFSIGGLQLLAADLFAGRKSSLREIFQRMKPLWTRLLMLTLLVYGSYFLWIILPALLGFELAATGSLGQGLFGLLLLIFVMYSVARLFVHFLFWQQAGALGSGDATAALAESKQLALGGKRRPWWERPLFRGALIASFWLVFFLFLNLSIELPYTYWKLHSAHSLEEMLALVKSLTEKSGWDWFSVCTTSAASLVNALVRGWLAALFVVLYLDSKANPIE